MFVDQLEQFGDRLAVVSERDGERTYAELVRSADAFAESLGPDRSLLMIESRPELEVVEAYIGALRANHSVMLVGPERPEVNAQLAEDFGVTHALRLVGRRWELESYPRRAVLHDELALLLATSGSTGAGKFVRLSRENVDSNARSIAESLSLDSSDRVITSLPLHYSYGHSLLSSHFAVGGAIVLTDRSVVDDDFWSLVESAGVTHLAGVPYTYKLLRECRLERRPLTGMRCLTQAGGRLDPDSVRHFAQLARERRWRFHVMYGQTEATARMTCMPSDKVLDHPERVGVPIPGGTIELRTPEGDIIHEPDVVGELVYKGPNVMLGYATGAAELAEGRTVHELVTGDLASRDEHGLIKIEGRRTRFLKVFGLRVSLDQVEATMKRAGLDAVATGSDELLVVAVSGGVDPVIARERLEESVSLPGHALEVVCYDELPRLPSGKVDYPSIRRDGAEQSQQRAGGQGLETVRGVLSSILGCEVVSAGDSFKSLGGDSLAFIQAKMALEQVVGRLPAEWDSCTVAQLESLPRSDAKGVGLEPVVLLRALAIVSVVVNHLWAGTGSLPFPIDGAAYFLMFAAGHSLARFQLSRVAEGASPLEVLKGLPRIAAPTWLLLAALGLYLGDLRFGVLTFTSNLAEPSVLNRFWFIETYIQLHAIVALALLLPAVRRLLAKRADVFSWGLLAVAISAQLMVAPYWTEFRIMREPQQALWMLALGMIAYTSQGSLPGRLTTLLVIGGCSYVEFGGHPSMSTWLTAGAAWTIFGSTVVLPRALARMIALVASASLYIYILHVPLLMKLHTAPGWVLLPLSVLIGVVGHSLAGRLGAVLRRVTRR